MAPVSHARWTLFALGVVTALAGCQPPVAPGYTRSAGSLALSRDDAYLYAVDTDSDQLAVIDTRTKQRVAQVAVGHGPERVVVGPDEQIYVSNRFSRSVSVIDRATWSERAQLPVGIEPMGLGVSGDGRTLYVVSSTALDSTATGTLTAIDTASEQTRWTLPVGAEPRGLALLSGGRALVSLAKAGDVALVDLDKPEVVHGGSSLYQQANHSRLSDTPPPGFGFANVNSFHARGMVDVAVTPDGTRGFAPTLWTREDPVTNSSAEFSGGGSYGGGGPCSGGAIVSAGLVTFDGTSGDAMADDLTVCGGGSDPGTDFPPTTIVTPHSFGPSDPPSFQGPVATVLDPTGTWLFVVGQETNNVAILPAHRRANSSGSLGMMETRPSSVRDLVAVGAGPTGIAISRDGKLAYVLNAFDHTISLLRSTGTDEHVSEDPSQRISFGAEVLPPDVVQGRKLFFAAADSRMTSSTTSVSCASCHLDAREDGHVWNLADGARQTPALAGRKMAATAPYHFSGEFPTLETFLDATVHDRLGGTGISAAEAASIGAYLESLPAADNPNSTATLSAAQQRGRALFAQASCDRCHGGEAFTSNGFSDVGTFDTGGVNPDSFEVRARGFNVPSLLGLARTAPYLHDGSAATLPDLLRGARASGRHGQLAGVSDAQLQDLSAYLETL